MVRVLSPNPRFSAGRSEGARHIPSRADQGCRVAVRRTSTAAHVEPGERGDAGQGPPRRRSRDSESSPAPVALREGKELINRMPQQRGWATSLEVAAGITNSLIDSYPFRPPPTHSESVEQKQLLVWRETPPFPPVAEMPTAQPCPGVAEKVSLLSFACSVPEGADQSRRTLQANGTRPRLCTTNRSYNKFVVRSPLILTPAPEPNKLDGIGIPSP